jgi:hypothetical protein
MEAGELLLVRVSKLSIKDDEVEEGVFPDVRRFIARTLKALKVSKY